MCHNLQLYPNDVPIQNSGNSDLDKTIPISGSGTDEYHSEWFTVGRATSIGQCLKCGAIYAASDTRFGWYPLPGFKHLYLS